jgi:hypothetical protein
MNAIYGQLEVEQMKKPATTIITNYLQYIIDEDEEEREDTAFKIYGSY